MKKMNITTETYEYNADYCIDIATSEDTYDAWLYNKKYGIKELMWGEPKGQQTYEEFVKLVELNVSEYIELYRERVEDE